MLSGVGCDPSTSADQLIYRPCLAAAAVVDVVVVVVVMAAADV